MATFLRKSLFICLLLLVGSIACARAERKMRCDQKSAPIPSIMYSVYRACYQKDKTLHARGIYTVHKLNAEFFKREPINALDVENMRKSAIKNNLLKDDKNYVRSEVLLVPTGDYLQKDRRSVYATFRDVNRVFVEKRTMLIWSIVEARVRSHCAQAKSETTVITGKFKMHIEGEQYANVMAKIILGIAPEPSTLPDVHTAHEIREALVVVDGSAIPAEFERLERACKIFTFTDKAQHPGIKCVNADKFMDAVGLFE